MTELSKERKRLIMDMVLYCSFSEHLDRCTLNEIKEKLSFFFDIEEIEFCIKKIQEDV